MLLLIDHVRHNVHLKQSKDLEAKAQKIVKFRLKMYRRSPPHMDVAAMGIVNSL